MEVSRRETQKRAIEKIAAYVTNNKNAIAVEYKVRRDEIVSCWTKFQELHDAVVQRSGATELSEQDDVIDLVRETYLSAKARLDYFIERLAKTKSADKTLAGRQEAVGKVIHSIRVTLSEKSININDAVAMSQRKEVETLYKQFQEIVVDRIAQGDDQIDVFKIQDVIRAEYLEILSLLAMANQSVANNFMFVRFRQCKNCSI